MTESDTHFMKAALEEARRGWGRTHPNPMVGAVIVESAKLVGRGYHVAAGGPHAEVRALSNLGGNPMRMRFSTLPWSPVAPGQDGRLLQRHSLERDPQGGGGSDRSQPETPGAGP